MNMAREVAEDAVAMAETMLDDEMLDHDECDRGDYALCGARFCNECGCLVDKLARAKALLSETEQPA
jgi:hypothetical protein